MIAAIYARKSTEQAGVVDEERSVTRQIEHARAYATRKGWTVDEGCVFVDDGISGAEFVKRPGLARLMNALRPRPPFQVLVMSEGSRLGREQIQTAYLLQQILDAGVRVFHYLEDRERTLDSAMDKVLLSLSTFAAETEREKANSEPMMRWSTRPRPARSPAAWCMATTTSRYGHPRESGSTSGGTSIRFRPQSCAKSLRCTPTAPGCLRLRQR